MNKTLLNFTATALLSTLLTHPCLVVAMGKKGHTSIVIEDDGSGNLTGANTLIARNAINDLQASAQAILGPQEQLSIEDRQGLEALLHDKAQGAAEDQQALAQSPKERRLLQPNGESGQTYIVDHDNKGPKVTRYDYRAVSAVDEDRGSCWKKPYPWIAGAAVTAAATGVVLCATGVICPGSCDEESDELGTALATLEANVTTAASTLTTLATTVITPLALPFLTTVKSLLTSTEAPSTLPQGIDSSMTPELLDALTTEEKTPELPTTTEEATSTSTSTTTPKPKKRRGHKKNRRVNTTTASTSTTELTTTPEQTTRTTTTTAAPTTTSTSTTTPKPKKRRGRKKNRRVNTTTASTSTTELTTTPEQTTRTTTTTAAPTTTSTSIPEQTTTLEPATTTPAHTTASTSTTKFVEENQRPSGWVPQCMATFHTQWMQSVQQNRDDFLAQCQQVINQKQLVRCKWQYHQKVQPYMQQYNEHLQPCIKKYSMQLMQEISLNNSGLLPEKDLQTIQQSNQQQINEACQRIEQKLSSHVQQWNGAINNRYANSYNAQQFVKDMQRYSQTLLKGITDDFTQLTQEMWRYNENQIRAYATAYQSQEAEQRRLQQEAAQRRQQYDVNNVSEAERARHNDQVLAQYRQRHNDQQIQSWQQATALVNQDYYQQAHVSNTGHNTVSPNYDYIDNKFYCYYPTGYTYVYYDGGWIDAVHPDGTVLRKEPSSNTFAWLGRY